MHTVTKLITTSLKEIPHEKLLMTLNTEVMDVLGKWQKDTYTEETHKYTLKRNWNVPGKR